jgi:hypothetical protein
MHLKNTQMKGLVHDLQALEPFLSTYPDVALEQYQTWCRDLIRHVALANLHLFMDKKQDWYFALGNNPKQPEDRMMYAVDKVIFVASVMCFQLHYAEFGWQYNMSCKEFINKLAEMFPEREKKTDGEF